MKKKLIRGLEVEKGDLKVAVSERMGFGLVLMLTVILSVLFILHGGDFLAAIMKMIH